MSAIVRLTTSFRGLSMTPVRVFTTTTVRLNVAANFATGTKKAPAKKAASKKAPTKKKVLTEKQLEAKKAASEKAKAAKKAKKAKEAADLRKLKKEAFKKPYKLSAFNVYIKENFDDSLSKTMQNFKALSDYEKDIYADKAADENDAAIAKWSQGKPEKRLSSFARFTSENYNKTSADFSENIRELSHRWSQLTTEEKDAYKTNVDAEEYSKQVKQWQAKRLAEYLEEKKQKNAQRKEK